MLGVGAGVRYLVPPDADTYYGKFAEFAREPGRYDTIFVGSSRVQHQLDPGLFDRECAARGVTTRSFNLGQPGSTMLQTSHTIREALRSGQPVKRVIIDPEFLELDIAPQNVRTQTTVEWHDVVTTARALACWPLPRETWKRRLTQLPAQLIPCGYRLTGYGRGQLGLSRWLENTGDAAWKVPQRSHIGPAGDGYLSYTFMLAESSSAFAQGLIAERDKAHSPEGLAEFATRLENLRKTGPIDGPPDPSTARVLSWIVQDVRAAGAEPIFLIGPVLDPRAEIVRAAKSTPPIIERLIRMNEPDKFPELFSPQYRFDHWHLNAEGATKFTQALSGAFVEMVEREGAGR